jgi:hypothetical protein
LYLTFLQVCSYAEHLLKKVPWGGSSKEAAEILTFSEEALKLGTRLHLLSLLIEVWCHSKVL